MASGRGPGGQFGPGNTFSTGRNQYGARKRTDLGFTFESKQMGLLARKVINQALSTSRPFQEANRQLGQELASYISSNLRDSVRAKGRAQRPKSQPNRLANAITDPRNIKATVDGYSVGYLDDIAAVRPYWRGLEVGSRRHVGRVLQGSFMGADGNLKRPVEGGKDPRFLQFRTKTFATVRDQAAAGRRGRLSGANAQTLGVRIKNEIVGYHYFERGIRDFVGQGFTREEARAIYVEALKGAGAAELASTLSNGSQGTRKSIGLKSQPAAPTPNPRD